mmetsp:Transcript_8641/g.18604  ORF Transcript_8641/g.18604 Transcript_8641/m.18604 type:complete len:202 (-) Transcript_8641:425-1030(-)
MHSSSPFCAAAKSGVAPLLSTTQGSALCFSNCIMQVAFPKYAAWLIAVNPISFSILALTSAPASRSQATALASPSAASRMRGVSDISFRSSNCSATIPFFWHNLNAAIFLSSLLLPAVRRALDMSLETIRFAWRRNWCFDFHSRCIASLRSGTAIAFSFMLSISITADLYLPSSLYHFADLRLCLSNTSLNCFSTSLIISS